MSNLLELVKRSQLRENIPIMSPGDTVRVHTRIIEGNKERIQIFEGIIIAKHNGQNSSTVTVRKISSNSIGVERTFLVHSPRIERFEITRRGRVRRAKLYYLRERQGKSARIKERKPKAWELGTLNAHGTSRVLAVPIGEPSSTRDTTVTAAGPAPAATAATAEAQTGETGTPVGAAPTE